MSYWHAASTSSGTIAFATVALHLAVSSFFTVIEGKAGSLGASGQDEKKRQRYESISYVKPMQVVSSEHAVSQSERLPQMSNDEVFPSLSK